MKRKTKYRIKNWSAYNKALVNRGSLTIWFDKKSVDSWYNKKVTGKKGRPIVYSNLAIQCCLTLKVIYHLPLRATQGFVSSLLELLQLPLSTPDYSLLSIRQKTLPLKLPKTRKNNEGFQQGQYHDLKYWKKKHNYHRRSLAETAMFRFKQLLGGKVQARTLQRQAKEIALKCIVINKINQLGMPAYS